MPQEIFLENIPKNQLLAVLIAFMMTLKFIPRWKTFQNFRHCNSSHVMCMHASLCGDVNAAGNNIYIKCSIAD